MLRNNRICMYVSYTASSRIKNSIFFYISKFRNSRRVSRHPSFLSLLTRDVTRKICFFLKLKYTVTLKRNKKNRGNWTGNRKFELFNRWLKRKFHRGTTCYVVWPSASLFSLSLSLARLFSSFLSSLARVIGHNIDTITLQSKL